MRVGGCTKSRAGTTLRSKCRTNWQQFWRNSPKPASSGTSQSRQARAGSAVRIAVEWDVRPDGLAAAGLGLLFLERGRGRAGHHRVDAVFGVRKSVLGGGQFLKPGGSFDMPRAGGMRDARGEKHRKC